MPTEGQSADAGGAASQDAGQQNGASDGAQQGGSADAAATSSQRSDDAAAVIARLNAEAKDWRQKYEAEQAKVREFEQKGMSELEKAQAQLAESERKMTELELTNQELRLSGSVRAAAVKAKAVDPDVVWRVIDLRRVETDAEGNPTNLDKLVGEVKKAHPVLFEQAAGDGDGGARGGPTSRGDMNELIRQGARRGTS